MDIWGNTYHTYGCNCKVDIETQNYVSWKGSLEFTWSIVLLRAGPLDSTFWQHQQGIL